MARKQSSTIWFEEKKHKEIFFDEHYHDKMYLTNEKGDAALLWEKLDGRGYDDFNQEFTFTVNSSQTVFYLYSDISKEYGGGCIVDKNHNLLAGNFDTAEFVIEANTDFEFEYNYRRGDILENELGRMPMPSLYIEDGGNLVTNAQTWFTAGRWSLVFDDLHATVTIRTFEGSIIEKLVLIGETNARTIIGSAPKINERGYSNITTDEYYKQSADVRNILQRQFQTDMLHPQLAFHCDHVINVDNALMKNNHHLTKARFMFAGSSSFYSILLSNCRNLVDITGCFAYSDASMDDSIISNLNLKSMRGAFYHAKGFYSFTVPKGSKLEDINSMCRVAGTIEGDADVQVPLIREAVKNMTGFHEFDSEDQTSESRINPLFVYIPSSGTRVLLTSQLLLEKMFGNTTRYIGTTRYHYTPKGLYYAFAGSIVSTMDVNDFYEYFYNYEHPYLELIGVFEGCKRIKHVDESFVNRDDIKKYCELTLITNNCFFDCTNADNYEALDRDGWVTW